MARSPDRHAHRILELVLAGEKDPRAAVHARVTDILVDQGWKHSLFFIVEQVPGMMARPSSACGGGSRSDWEEWILELRRRAPMWRFSMDVEQQFMVATEPATDLHCGFARCMGHEPRIASLDSCDTMLVAGSFAPRIAKHARGWPDCSAAREFSLLQKAGEEISRASGHCQLGS